MAPRPKKSYLWQTEAERVGGKALVAAITELKDGQVKILKLMDDMQKRQTTSEIRTDKLFTAFPMGDVDGHNRYHDELIQSVKERRELYKYIAKQTFTGLVWLGIVYLGSVFVRETTHALGYILPQVNVSK